MTTSHVDRDERTIAVEGRSYRLSYQVLSFGLLIIVAIRSFTNHEQPWDLIGLVILGGAVNAIYQGMNNVLYKRWAITALVTLVAAALVAVVVRLLHA